MQYIESCSALCDRNDVLSEGRKKGLKVSKRNKEVLVSPGSLFSQNKVGCINKKKALKITQLKKKERKKIRC